MELQNRIGTQTTRPSSARPGKSTVVELTPMGETVNGIFGMIATHIAHTAQKPLSPNKKLDEVMPLLEQRIQNPQASGAEVVIMGGLWDIAVLWKLKRRQITPTEAYELIGKSSRRLLREPDVAKRQEGVMVDEMYGEEIALEAEQLISLLLQ